MVIERNLLISLLKLTRRGSVFPEQLQKDAKTTKNITRETLEKLQKEAIILLNKNGIEADSYSRIKLATKAISMGADVEYVSNLLHWQEFEGIAAIALERNGYKVTRNLRFKHMAKKWEIDVVGCLKPLIVCIDCKHWRRGTAPSAVRRITESQVERTRALADVLPDISLNIEGSKWNKAKFLPAVLTLMPTSFKFYDKVPIVPVLQLQDFLSQLPAYIESLKYMLKYFNHLNQDF